MSNMKTEANAIKKDSTIKTILQKMGSIIALLILIIVFCIALPDKFPRIANVMNILKQASINCLISSGMLCALITAGIDLSVGSNCVLCTCTIAVLVQHGVKNPALLILVGLCVSTLAGFINGTLLAVMFPYTAELAEKGKSTKSFVLKAAAATLGTGAILAAVFTLAGEKILSILPNGDTYSKFAWATPCLIVIMTLHAMQSYHTNTEISAGRFGFLKWWIPFHIICPAFLLFVTGHGYFRGIIPPSWTDFFDVHNFTSLKSMITWFFVAAIVKLCISGIDFHLHGNGEKST